MVGYCLRSSCSWVTHLAVLQVCSNRVGGLKDADELILGVIKLPYGDMPGYLISLQGRNYIENFLRDGPYTQPLDDSYRPDDSSLYALWASGAGPVAPPTMEGSSGSDGEATGGGGEGAGGDEGPEEPPPGFVEETEIPF